MNLNLVKIIFTERNAGAVIHTHSKNAVLVTLLCDKEFKISQQEMIKVCYQSFYYIMVNDVMF